MSDTFLCSEIIPGRLFLGTKKFAQNQQLYKTLGINAIVNLQEVPLMLSDTKIPIHWSPIKDTEDQGIDWIEEAAKFIDVQFAANKKVFVHCVMGMSRSPILVIYYLMTRNVETLTYKDGTNTHTLRDALEYVLSKRSVIRPNIGFIKCLIAFEKTNKGIESMTEKDYEEILSKLLLISIQ